MTGLSAHAVRCEMCFAQIQGLLEGWTGSRSVLDWRDAMLTGNQLARLKALFGWLPDYWVTNKILDSGTSSEMIQLIQTLQELQ